jgi:hypothetical protein
MWSPLPSVCTVLGREESAFPPCCPSIQSNLDLLVGELYSLPWKTASRQKASYIRPGRAMSPLVERKRPQTTPRIPSTDQHWSMLLFESLSAGAMAVLLGFAAVVAVVGVYVILVWPLTFWDLADSGLEKYGAWASTAVWSVFAGGSLAGYWCFSGAAFKTKSSGKRAGAPVRSARPPHR